MLTTVRVLIVDDDAVDLELTRRLLAGGARMHCEVDTASQLADAIRMIHQKRYDVLLLDLNLPGSQGLATVDAVRAASDQLPILVLSGLSDEQTALQSLDRGTQDYLVKGNVTSETLINAVRHAIQRQQLLQEITKAKELLERKNERLAELYATAHRFVDNVSHEFRTPLTVVKEYAALIRDGLVGTVTHEQCRFLDIVGDRADDLNTMVDDMLDVSKLEAGLLGVWRRNCRVADVIEDVWPSLERKSTIKGITLTRDIDDDLPEVYCDDEKVRRVIINLTINAIKFCQQNGRVCIRARRDPQASGVRIEVTDNGPGMPAESLADLFQRFKQLQTSTRSSSKGFGLGLSIPRELVDLNYGEMDVQSEVGKGSTFSFTLPPAEPVEVMRRYLRRVAQLRVVSPTVIVVSASIDSTDDPATLDDIDGYLQGLLRRDDLLFRADQQRWILLLAIDELELHKFFAGATKTFHDLNRNRLQGPLPTVAMHADGAWHVPSQSNDIFDHVCDSLSPKELIHV